MTVALNPMIPEPFRVQHIRRETHDTFTLELRPDNGRIDFPFAPGQFNMLYAHGIGEVPISISGDPGVPETLTHTLRSVGAVTGSLSGLKKGDRVGVRGPFGSTWPADASMGNDLIIIAGGIGLAPLRPLIYRMLQERDRYGRVAILYGTRSPNDILYRDELEAWRARFDLDVSITVDQALSGWRGSIGVVSTLIGRIHIESTRTVAFLCGPEVMMRFTAVELRKHDVPTDRIFLSMERNMKCGIGLCGHCQYGPAFVCKDGPVFPYGRIQSWLSRREV